MEREFRHILLAISFSPLSFPHCDPLPLFNHLRKVFRSAHGQIIPSILGLELLPRSFNLSCVQHKRRCFAAVSECLSFPFRPRRLFAQLFALSPCPLDRPSVRSSEPTKSISSSAIVRSFAPRTNAPLSPLRSKFPHVAFPAEKRDFDFANRDTEELRKAKRKY